MSIFMVYLKSVLLGMAIAMPVGPIGLICIRSTLTLGFMVGIAAGLGAAFADALYGFIAALGLSVITTFLISKIDLIKILGGLFLIYLGLKESRAVVPVYLGPSLEYKVTGVMASTFFLTLANPMTILSFIAVFPSIASNGCGVAINSVITVAGVLTGSLLWWLTLCAIIKYIHRYMPSKALQLITLTSSAALIVFGLYTCLGTILPSI
jgi:putative LysE/RhtB family amino acid efflux pump